MYGQRSIDKNDLANCFWLNFLNIYENYASVLF